MVAADIQASQVEMELPPAVGRQWQEQVVELASDELAIGELAIDDTDDFAAIEPAMELSSGAAFAGGDGDGEDENDASEDGHDQVDGDVAEIDEAADEIDEDELDEGELDEGELDEGELDEADVDEDELFLAVAPLEQRLQPVSIQPLRDAPLPASVYMLVDKTVELEVRPLKEFPELGLLPPDEEERQALQVFVNPRQAKRHCGRSQRVIKIPDTRIFERTASHLLAQGISRVVIENSLYSLPGA
jgi:cobalamin biosynthesis protein CobT